MDQENWRRTMEITMWELIQTGLIVISIGIAMSTAAKCDKTIGMVKKEDFLVGLVERIKKLQVK